MRTVGIFLLGFIAGCCACKPMPEPPPSPEPDMIIVDACAADYDGAVGDIYDAACSILARLNCPESDTTDAGTNCHDSLKKLESFGTLGVHAECIATAHSLSAVRACNVRCAH